MKICEENVRAAFDQLIGGETLSDWDKQRILRNAEAVQRRRAMPRLPRRLAAAAAALVLAATGATGALAAVPGLAETLSMLSRRTVEFLRPVEVECEDSGIRAQVIAAMNDEDTAVTYISLEDTTGQNRLDATTGAPGCAFAGRDHLALIDNVYCKPDGSIILRLVGYEYAGRETGNKVTLTMDHLISGGQTAESVDLDCTLADIMAGNPDPSLNAGTVIDQYDILATAGSRLFRKLESGSFRTLKIQPEGVKYAEENSPWLRVYNIGVVDGILHILTQRDEAAWFNTVHFDFADANGERLHVNNAVLYLGENRHLGRFDAAAYTEYQEYLLEIPEGADPAQLRLVCDLNVYSTCIRGDWSLTFNLEEPQQLVQIDCDLDMNPWRIEQAQLSPVGLSFTGSGMILEESLMPEPELVLQDGTVIGEVGFGSYTSTIGYDEQGNEVIHLNCLLAEPLNLETVQEVRVNGRQIWSR